MSNLPSVCFESVRAVAGDDRRANQRPDPATPRISRLVRDVGQARAVCAVALQALSQAFWTRAHAEPAAAVRRATVDAAAVIAERCLPAGEWPELLPGLQTMAISPEAGHRESASVLFKALAEAVPDALVPFFPHFEAVVRQGLQDSDAAVRFASVESFGALLRARPSCMSPLPCRIVQHEPERTGRLRGQDISSAASAPPSRCTATSVERRQRALQCAFALCRPRPR